MAPPPNLAGRRIVITGAGRGLGRALAIAAADCGAEPVLLGRRASALERVAGEIEERTGRCVLSVDCDLSAPDSIAKACRRTLEAAPVVDVLINNGAPWLPGRLEELNDAEITHTLLAGVAGTLLMTKGLLPGLRRSAGADIVTIVSTSGLPGHCGGSGSIAFSAAKHGQAALSAGFQQELKRHGIRSIGIYPPDFEDTDPLDAEWDAVRDPSSGAKLTNREVVAAVMFAITAPRVCAYSVLVLDNTADSR